MGFRVDAHRLPGLRLVAALLSVLAAPAAAQGQWQKNEYQLQKEFAEKLMPAPLLAPRREGGGKIVPVRLRFHADASYRAEGGRWQDNIKVLLGHLNQVVGQSFGIRFEAVEFRRWERSGPQGALAPMLEQLEKRDPGTDVDWVVGLVSAMEPSEREQLYGIRKAHKETSVFLHEWGHTLGAPHVEDPTRIMSPGYSQRTSLFSNEDAELIAAALDSRLRSRGRETAAIDWSPLHQYLKTSRNPEWRPADKQTLLELSAPRAGVAPGNERAAAAPPAEEPVRVPPPFGLRPLPRGGIPLPPPEAADRPAAPPPGAPEGAGRAAAAGTGAAAARRSARTPEPPFAVEARALMRAGQWPKALALLERTATELARQVPPDPAAQASVARVYAEAGAFTAAERTLARAGDAPPIRQAALEVQRARRRLGVPKSVARFQLPPSAEPEYAEIWDRLRNAMNAGDLKSAKSVVDSGLRKFPGAPGLITADCEVLLRQDRPEQATKRCQEALAIMEDLPRAHYLLGCIQAEGGQHEAGVTSLKRAIALDPRNRAAWESLSDLLRALGRSKDYQKFAAQHGGPPGDGP